MVVSRYNRFNVCSYRSVYTYYNNSHITHPIRTVYSVVVFLFFFIIIMYPHALLTVVYDNSLCGARNFVLVWFEQHDLNRKHDKVAAKWLIGPQTT